MAVFTIARFEVRPETCAEVERAMHEYATYVRAELPDSVWSTYREPAAPSRFTSLVRTNDVAADARHRGAPGTHAFHAKLTSCLVGTIDVREYELVTSSDLAPRFRPDRRATPRRGRPR